MAAETASGLGQGAAQIFNPSASANLFVAQQDSLRKERELKRQAEQKRKDAIQQELSGQFDDLYKSKLFETRDSEYFYGKVNELEKKWAGKGEKLWNDPQLQTQFGQEVGALRMTAQKSAAVKEELKAIRTKMYDSDKIDQFTDEQRGYFEKVYSTPGYGVDVDEIDFEMFKPQQKLPDIISVIDKAIPMDKFVKETPVVGTTTVGGHEQIVQGTNTTFDEESYRQAALGLIMTDESYVQGLEKQFGDIAKVMSEQTGADVTPFEAMMEWRKTQKGGLEKRDRTYKNVPSGDSDFYTQFGSGGYAETGKFNFAHTPEQELKADKYSAQQLGGGDKIQPATIDVSPKSGNDNPIITIPVSEKGKTSEIKGRPVQFRDKNGELEVIYKPQVFRNDLNKWVDSEGGFQIVPYEKVKGKVQSNYGIDLEKAFISASTYNIDGVGDVSGAELIRQGWTLKDIKENKIKKVR